MVLLPISAVLYALFLSASALPASTSYKQFEALEAVPAGWVYNSNARINTAQRFELKIHLTQQNVAKFEQHVYDISTPGHPAYGQHMTAEEVKYMLRPTTKTITAVHQWLASAGLSDRVTAKDDWVFVDVTLAEAEELLQTKYNAYSHEGGAKTLRTTSYSLPQHMHEHINMIQPTTMFGRGRAAIKTTSVPAPRMGKVGVTMIQGKIDAACGTSITPTCLANLYQFAGYKLPANATGNVLGVNGYLEQYAQNADLTTFLNKYVPSAKGASFVCQGIKGGLCTQNPSSDFTEANLDIQYTVGISNPTQNIYYSTAGRPPFIPDPSESTNNNEPYLDNLNYILGHATVPQTITTSYGDDEQTVPLSYATTVCNLFAQLGARGASVMFSSGDSGPGGTCTDASGKNIKFIPNFPASCPFITSVGGTVGVSPERAVDFSSGGFSNYFGRPSYQDSAVNAYLATSSAQQFKQYYNASGRAIPDVAAQGSNFHVIISGSDQLVSGTSASSPAFAAIISLLNGDRLARGQKPLGFLNPWLYGPAKSGLNDITSGTSSGCQGQISGAGFPAQTGWDGSTGLGTPNFSKLRAISAQTN